MNYILTLCLSGSAMGLMYFGVKRMAGNRLSAEWQYRIIKGVIVFYLFPLPFLKSFYVTAFNKLVGEKSPIGLMRIYQNTSLIVFQEGELVFNETFKRQFHVLLIWMIITACVMLWYGVHYLINRKRLNQYKQGIKETTDAKQMELLREQYSIRRKIEYLDCSNRNSKISAVFTTGIFRPTVFCSTEAEGWEKEMILKHEMVHIKRWDVLWRMLMLGVQIAHWYNPLVWLLSREFDKVCEMSCDECVLQGEEDEAKGKYGKLLIAMAMEGQQEKPYILGLSKGGKQLKERIDNVMRDRKRCFGKLLSVCILGAMVLLNSLTVFAYEDVQFARTEKDNEKYLNSVLRHDVEFIPGEEEETQKYTSFDDFITDVEIIYDSQFTDAEGNTYPIYENETESYALCEHNYVAGMYREHEKYSDGSCTLTIYYADRCTKCGTVQVGKEQNSINYKICPH